MISYLLYHSSCSNIKTTIPLQPPSSDASKFLRCVSGGTSGTKTKVSLHNFLQYLHGYLVLSRLKKNLTIIYVVLLGCWGEVICMYPLRLRPNTYLILGVTMAHMGQLLLKRSITDFYVYCIFVEYLRYKVLIIYSCGSSGGNSLLILTTLE